jgi:hypothetical protein
MMNETKQWKKNRTYCLPEDEAVDIPGEHGRSGEDRRIGGGHHRRRHSAQAEKCNIPKMRHKDIDRKQNLRRETLNDEHLHQDHNNMCMYQLTEAGRVGGLLGFMCVCVCVRVKVSSFKSGQCGDQQFTCNDPKIVF